MFGTFRIHWLSVAIAACAPAAQTPAHSMPEARHGIETPVVSPPAASISAHSTSDPVAQAGRLTVAEARRLMVELINRDRASAGLRPVVLDEGPASRAGQAHAEDMAKHGYLGHWGTDGSVPEQRFTEAGGTDMVLENASCFVDERPRELDRSPRIDPKNVELTESMFFHEVPPHDGHRKNILKPWHQRVGIGIAQPVATTTELPSPCAAQEFVDSYGAYSPLPPKLRVGETLHVAGSIAPPATFAGVGLARVDEPRPLAPSELNRRRSYPVPMPYQMYWPPGYETPIAVKVTGRNFGIDLPVSDAGRDGLYELSIWASIPGTGDPVMVSLRTIPVTRAR